MKTPSSSTTHPILRCAATIEAALDDVADLDPIFMDVTAKREALVVLDRLTSRVSALKLRIVAAADDVADAEGQRDVASWLAGATRGDGSTARREQRLAQACDARWREVGAALSSGRINVEQAHVLTRSLDDLARTLRDLADDDSVSPPMTGDRITDLLCQAESHLLAEADQFGPRDLARLGAGILQVIAPHVFDDAEGRRLADQDRHARRVTSLSSQRLGDGTALIKARVPESVATRLLTTLEAFTNPRKHPASAAERATGTDRPDRPDGPHRAQDATGEGLPYPVRLGQAFCSLLEGLDPNRLPLHGGTATSLVITLDLETLIRGVGHGTLPTGETVSAGELRRLACTADLIPAVLGTGSHALDLGLTARLFSPAQRRALALRDTHCRARGCDIPATWCEAHHLVPWSGGGRTDLENGVLLCSHHHHRIHDDRYLHERLPNGDIRFSRRR